MKMKVNTGKIFIYAIVEYAGAIVTASIISLSIYGLGYLAAHLKPAIGEIITIKVLVYTILFFGLPAGSSGGIVLVRRTILGDKDCNLSSLFLGYLVSLGGLWGTLFLCPILMTSGPEILYLLSLNSGGDILDLPIVLPLVTGFFALLGCNIQPMFAEVLRTRKKHVDLAT
jgi:hypothetical protein